MDDQSFYRSNKLVNAIPGDGSLSDDELASDSDSEYVPQPRIIQHQRILPEIFSENYSPSSESEDDDIVLPSTSKNIGKGKKKVEKVNWVPGYLDP